MANSEHLAQIKLGVESWNKWRKDNPDIQPDLSEADLSKANLVMVNFGEANLRGANLSDADLNWATLNGADLRGAHLDRATLSTWDYTMNSYGADLSQADLSGAVLYRADLKGATLRGTNLTKADLMSADLWDADLSGAILHEAKLYQVDFSRADLSNADLSRAYLHEVKLKDTNLSGADLSGADLSGAALIGTQLEGANLSNCSIYGISVWKASLKGAIQSNLRITPDEEPTIHIDNLEVAQFVYLLLKSEKIRNVIDTIGQRGVLILGRFVEERKHVLDAIRDKLRDLGFIPMMFDFERPTQRDFTETIKTLAGLSRFIIADITNPKSSPLELQATMPDYMIPFVPIIQAGEQPFSMFSDLKNKYREWVLDVLSYNSVDEVVVNLEDEIVKPALAKSDELAIKKAKTLVIRPITQHA